MKRLLAVLMVVAMAVSIVACAGTSSKATSKDANRKLKIAYCAKDLSNVWQQNMQAALTGLQKKYNFELLVSDAGSSPEKQITQVQSFITQGVDGIITLIADEGISPTIAKMCSDAGVTLIGEAISLTDTNGKLVAPTVETNAVTFGQMCATWISENYKSVGFDFGDYSSVGFVTITDGSVQSMVDRCKAAEVKFTELFPKFPKDHVFKADVAGGTSVYAEAAYNQLSAVITANPKIKNWIVVAGGDNYAQGGARAIESAGLDKTSILVSMGGELAVGEWATGLNKCWYAACYFSALECADMCMQGMTSVVRNGTKLEDLYPTFKQPGQTYAAAYFKAQMITPANYKDIVWSHLLNAVKK